jgi:hypothetical protein
MIVKLTEPERVSLRKKLLAKLLADCREAKAIGYPPNDFLAMLERGAVEACTQVIMATKLPSGFAKLYELKRLELTAEATVVDGPWRALFPREVIDAANKRLKRFDRADLVRP